MRIETEFPHPQMDTLRYRLEVERTLAQEDVRVSVDITALAATRDADKSQIENRIRASLAEFISADWVFARVARQGDAPGYERVTLRASARVPAAEAYNLEDRARHASREGVSIEKPQVDDSLSSERMAEVLHELRLEALGSVAAQLPAFEKSTGRRWRIGDMDFGIEEDEWSYRRRMAKGAYRGSAHDALDEGPQELVGAERIRLIVQVTLKAVAV